MEDLCRALDELKTRINRMKEHLDVPEKEKEVVRIETESSQPDFWQDQIKAQQAMRRMARLKATVESWHALAKKCNNLVDLIDLAIEESDDSLQAESAAEAEEIERLIEEMEFQETLGGEYDPRDAMLAIHAGAGGTESQDWAEMLLRMYLRWAEKRRFHTEVIETSPGDEAGIKSTLVEIKGDYAYGYLKSERGVHRLVRLSPFDADHARHTSFALVEVMPEVESDVDVNINQEDIKIDTFRSSGPGGQHMQKTSSAVRITHVPTGIVATCQSERSQARNKETALRVLASRLLELDLEKKSEAQAKLKGEHVTAGWGNQIRSYVLHPYKMVKDHRSNYETSNPDAVLDGDLDVLIRAYLKSTLES
ncbi:MAG: peptide chain release factor 2 [Chloroflexota bacterium]|nr:peptide chain release factor 2 [Chloroflexota bacterium]